MEFLGRWSSVHIEPKRSGGEIINFRREAMRVAYVAPGQSTSMDSRVSGHIDHTYADASPIATVCTCLFLVGEVAPTKKNQWCSHLLGVCAW